MAPTPTPAIVRPAYIMDKLGVILAVCRMPPTRKKKPAIMSRYLRPRYFEKARGRRLPTMPPAFNSVTTVPEVLANLCGLPNKSKLLPKLDEE